VWWVEKGYFLARQILCATPPPNPPTYQNLLDMRFILLAMRVVEVAKYTIQGVAKFMDQSKGK